MAKTFTVIWFLEGKQSGDIDQYVANNDVQATLAGINSTKTVSLSFSDGTNISHNYSEAGSNIRLTAFDTANNGSTVRVYAETNAKEKDFPIKVMVNGENVWQGTHASLITPVRLSIDRLEYWADTYNQWMVCLKTIPANDKIVMGNTSEGFLSDAWWTYTHISDKDIEFTYSGAYVNTSNSEDVPILFVVLNTEEASSGGEEERSSSDLIGPMQIYYGDTILATFSYSADDPVGIRLSTAGKMMEHDIGVRVNGGSGTFNNVYVYYEDQNLGTYYDDMSLLILPTGGKYMTSDIRLYFGRS